MTRLLSAKALRRKKKARLILEPRFNSRCAELRRSSISFLDIYLSQRKHTSSLPPLTMTDSLTPTSLICSVPFSSLRWTQ